VLPFDSLWLVFQNVRFGYLYPDERFYTLFSGLLRNMLLLLLCVYETREVHEHLNWKAFWIFGLMVFGMVIWFISSPNPSWTDWTYAYRFGYGLEITFGAFLVSHVVMKLFQAIIFWNLWRVKVEK